MRLAAFIPAVFLTLGCARDESMDALLKLQEGITRLESGDNIHARDLCRDAARVLGDASSLHCWLVAAIRTQAWEQAARAAFELRTKATSESGLPMSQDWYAATEMESLRRKGEAQLPSPVPSSPEIAWACLEGGCPPPEETSPLSPLLRALLAWRNGSQDSAIQAASNGTDLETLELYLLLLLKAKRYEELAGTLSLLSCHQKQDSTVAASIAAFLRLPDFSSDCTDEKSQIKSVQGANLLPPAEAARFAEAAALSNPDSAVLRLNAGVQLLRSREYQKASHHFRVARRLASDPVLPEIYQCLTLLILGETEPAEETFASLREALPPDWSAWLQNFFPPGSKLSSTQ